MPHRNHQLAVTTLAIPPAYTGPTGSANRLHCNVAAVSPIMIRRLDMRNPRIGILVVAYNAESTLRQTLHRIPGHLRSKIEEIFVFDDASQDRTLEVCRQCQEEW